MEAKVNHFVSIDYKYYLNSGFKNRVSIYCMRLSLFDFLVRHKGLFTI